MMRVTFTITALALAFAGCDAAPNAGKNSSSGGGAPALTAAEADKIVNDAYAAFTSGDAVQMMGHYAPDAVVIDAANNLPSNDRAMINKWTADFAAMKPSDLITNPKIVQSFNDDTIVSSGVAAFLADVGGRRQRVSVRYTHVFEKQADGRWLIVAEHNSIPPQPVSTGL
jgi:uncharacterized protein (TIGR02246 family)